MELRSFTLGRGSHPDRRDIGCVNEIASQLAGESWGDTPPCVDPVINRLSVWYNDSFATDEALNADEFARSLPWRLVGTRSTAEVEQQRAYMAADWAVRFVCPILLRRASLVKEAESLERLPVVDSRAAARAARAAARAARAAADAARAVAHAARAVAHAARAAARAAAHAAARAAADLDTIRRNCAELLDRMIRLTEPQEKTVVPDAAPVPTPVELGECGKYRRN